MIGTTSDVETYIETCSSPSEKQDEVQKQPRGTFCTTAAMVIFGLSAVITHPPEFRATYQPETQIDCNGYEQNGFIGLVGLIGYSIEGFDVDKINSYLLSKPNAATLLYSLKSIVNQVYEGAAKLKLSLYSESDTDEDLIVVATILSGLPIDNEFATKDQLVFNKLTEAGLAGGLRQVIIEQG